MPKGLPVRSARTFETITFGEVPTSVTMPPMSEAEAIGISSAEGGVPLRRASCRAMGMKMASAPTFFVTIDRSRTPATRIGTCRPGLVRRGMSGRIRVSTAPERAMAAERTRAEPTMTTMSSEKPEKALSAGTRPSAIPAASAVSATTS